MQHIQRFALLLLVPILAVLVATAGCNKDKDGGAASDGGASKDGKGGNPPKAGERTAVAATDYNGTLMGKVTYEGDPPKPADFKDQMEKHQDKATCLAGPTADPKWVVGPDKGVANVVVWIRPVNYKNQYFQIPDDLKKPKDKEVVIDQPHCAFEPHLVTVFPSYYNPKEKQQEPTGQTLRIDNSAKIPHNTKWYGSDTGVNPGDNPNLKPGDNKVLPVRPSQDKAINGAQLISLKCNVHTWMTGYAYVFDHPFHAKTDKDGSYKIAHVPTGAEVEILYWHEDLGEPHVLKKITLKPENSGDFQVKK